MINTVTELMNEYWRDIEELPKLNYSFQVLIQFEEFGLNGEHNKYLSTGVWRHIGEYLQIDNEELQDLTPAKFFPLYENVH